jgi:hypothetical protein
LRDALGVTRLDPRHDLGEEIVHRGFSLTGASWGARWTS